MFKIWSSRQIWSFGLVNWLIIFGHPVFIYSIVQFRLMDPPPNNKSSEIFAFGPIFENNSIQFTSPLFTMAHRCIFLFFIFSKRI